MKTKHTFLFTMLLGLAWVGFLFAYPYGPDPGANGIFGPGTACDQPGCHVGNPENSLGLAVTINGLPDNGYTPGQTYPLQVTVPLRMNTSIYGFQLSAVFDSNRQQAGTLSVPSSTNTVQVISGGGVQYAEHTLAGTSIAFRNTYNVNWTAPPNASGGVVKFNVAGNAANGDHNDTGDFIYINVFRVSPVTPPADFSISAASSASVIAGNSTTVNFSATAINGFTGTVNLTIDGLQCGAAASFAPPAISGDSTSTLTISTTAGATTGVFPLTITATSGNLVHAVPLTLTISAPGGPTQSFTIANLGGTSLSTAGGCDRVTGYVRIQPDAGKTIPAGVEIFGFTQNNTLVSETGVTASPLLTEGRIYAEDSGASGLLHTGVAIANPNNQTANIQFFYTDSAGISTAVKSLPIGSNSQIAAFLYQDQFFPGTSLQGTFSFKSDVPISVIALRGLTNADQNFLMSTLPVIDTSVPGPSGIQTLPHFATGDGWTTQVFLVNPGTAMLTGNLQFLGATGSPVNVVVGGQTANTAAYSVASRSAQKFVVTGPTAGGSIRISPAVSGGAVPTSVVLFSQARPTGVVATEAAAQVSSGTAFRMYVETSAPSAGNIDSGIAVANTSAAAVNVTLELFKLDGTSAGVAPVQIPLQPGEKIATFVSQRFPSARPFKGILRISGSGTISAAGLRSRYNERPDFLITTVPVSLEAAATSAAEMLFPHLVDGGGYTTQFILFSGTAGQTSSGILRFFTTTGAQLNLSLNN